MMLNRCRIVLSFVFAWALLLAGSPGLASERVTTVIYEVLKAGTPFELLPKSDVSASYAGRRLSQIEIRAFTIPNGKPLQLSLNGSSLGSVAIPTEKPSDTLDLPVSVVKLPQALAWKNISSVRVTPGTDCLFASIAFEFEGDPAPSFDGSAYEEQLDRLDRLSQHNLFEEHNLGDENELIRTLAVADLLQYPSTRAFEIAAERFDFHGTWIDFDMQRKAKEVIERMPGKIIERFPEEKEGIEFLDVLYESHHWEIRAAALYATREFKTGAPVGLLIRAHGDGFRSFNPMPNALLAEALKKPGASEALHRFVPFMKAHLEKIAACGDQCEDAYGLWVADAMVESLASHPQREMIGELETMARKLYRFWPLDRAIDATFTAFDFSEEFRARVDEMGKIVTEPYKPYDPNDWQYGFAHWRMHRRFAALALVEAGGEAARKYMLQALKIQELEEELRKLFEAATQQSGGHR